MRHNDVIYLLASTVEYDAIGNPVETSTERQVFANRFGVGMNEFYDASAQGLKPEKEFEIYSFEYENETKLKHENITYQIIRAQSKGEKTRIVCQKDVR